MRFKFIGHVETMAAISRLHRITHGDPWKNTPDCNQMIEGDLPHKTLLLRCQKNPSVENFPDDLPMFDEPEFEQSKVWKNLIARSRKQIFGDPMIGPLLDATAKMGRAVISVLSAGGVMSWHKDVGEYAKRHLRFHVPLVTNPLCKMHAGPDVFHAPVGSIFWIDVLDLHCASNWGLGHRSHMIFEFRRRDAAEAA